MQSKWLLSMVMFDCRKWPRNPTASMSSSIRLATAIPAYERLAIYTTRSFFHRKTHNFKFSRAESFRGSSSKRSNSRKFQSCVELNSYDGFVSQEDGKGASTEYEENLSSAPSSAGYGDADLEAENCSFFSANGTRTRLHYLEETDEGLLSKRILALSRSNKVISAMELFQSMEVFGLKPNLHACNSLLSCLLRKKLLDDALRLFKYMKTNKITSGHSYSMVLKALANDQGSAAALQMFMELDCESNLKKDFDAVVYNTMISICGKENDWTWMERMWSKMKENGHIGTSITYRVLVCTFVRCGQYELAIDAYSEMLQQGILPGADAMHAVIGACAKEGKFELALTVFHNMLDSGMKPNLVSCNALINSLGKAGKVNTAFGVFDQMKSLGHCPDTHTWNALLGALYRANQYADSLQLFHRIRKEKGVESNIQLYNTALMCCKKLRLWNTAVQLLWLMENSDLVVPTTSYNLVIDTCEVAMKPKIALQVFDHMVHKKCEPDTFTYSSLARSCIWGSLWMEVEEILKLTEDASIYNTVIQGMCLKGRIEPAKNLYKKMREIGLMPDGKTRAMMLQHLSRV